MKKLLKKIHKCSVGTIGTILLIIVYQTWITLTKLINQLHRTCVSFSSCVLIVALLSCHRETVKEWPPKPRLTWSDSSVHLSLALTADRWIALIHRRKNRHREREKTGGKRGRKRERKPPGWFASTTLFRGPMFDWVLHRIINPLLPSAVPSFLSFLISHFLSNPGPPFNSLLLSPALSLSPMFWRCHCFMLPILFPRPIFNTCWSIFMFLSRSLTLTLHSSAIWLYLPSQRICLSLSEVSKTGVRGPCQTKQQHSLTAIPLCIWLCIWICTTLCASTTKDTESIHVHTRGQLSPQWGLWCTILATALYQRHINNHDSGWTQVGWRVYKV